MPSEACAQSPKKFLVWGVLIVFLSPILIVLFAITIIGIPVALVMAAAYMLILFVGGWIAGFAIGSRIAAATKIVGLSNIYLQLFVGLIVLELLAWTLFVGGLVRLIVVLLGVGAVMVSIRSSNQKKSSSSKAPARKTMTRRLRANKK